MCTAGTTYLIFLLVFSRLCFFAFFGIQYFQVIWGFSMAIQIRINNEFSRFFSKCWLVAPLCNGQWVPSAKFSPWLKRLPTAPKKKNTLGTAAAQRIRFPLKSFLHKSFWESSFHAPLCLQWKALTSEPHASK